MKEQEKNIPKKMLTRNYIKDLLQKHDLDVELGVQLHTCCKDRQYIDFLYDEQELIKYVKNGQGRRILEWYKEPDSKTYHDYQPRTFSLFIQPLIIQFCSKLARYLWKENGAFLPEWKFELEEARLRLLHIPKNQITSIPLGELNSPYLLIDFFGRARQEDNPFDEQNELFQQILEQRF